MYSDDHTNAMSKDSDIPHRNRKHTGWWIFRVIVLYTLFASLTSCDNKNHSHAMRRSLQTPTLNNVGNVSGRQDTEEPEADPLVANALRVLGAPSTPDNDEAQAAAIDLLRSHPTPRVISLLVDKGLSVVAPHHYHMDDDTYPAYVALRKIGEPAVPQISERIKMTTNGAEQLSLIDTLIAIKGWKWVVEYMRALEQVNTQSHTTMSFGRLAHYANAFGR